jgi:tetratricopeptide (TPR) repeat protein
MDDSKMNDNDAAAEVSKARKVAELSKKANELLKAGQIEEATRTFLEAYNIDDTNPYVLVGLGDICRKQKNFRKAIEYYEKVIERESYNVFALRGIGIAYRGLEEYEKAIEYWEQYIDLNEDDYLVLTRLGDSSKKLGRYKDSEKFYLKALEVCKGDKYIYLGLGDLYYMVGNLYRRKREFDNALPYYQRALAKDSRNIYAMFGIGDCMRGVDDINGAIEWWEKIIALDAKNLNTLARLGDAYLKTENTKKAKEYYKRALEITDHKYALMGLARIHRMEGNYDDAITIYRQLLTREKMKEDRVLKELYETRQEQKKLAGANNSQ